jgi:hypothetical protein
MNMRAFTIAAVSALSISLGGCAMQSLPPPVATLDNIQALRAADVAPMKVGGFTPGPGAPTEMDQSITVRAGVQPAPEGSFAKYLGDTIAVELTNAGKLDPNSNLIVSGVVTDTHVDSGLPAGTAHAALAAKFTLVRSGRVVFDKTLDVASSWDSEFVGAVAIPDAINHYTDLFQKLAHKLFADPEFVSAAHGG